MRNKTGILSLSALCFAMLATHAFAADPAGEPGRSAGGKNPLNNVYFGEQHLHTADSADAFAMGTRNTQDEAYRYCKGEAIKKSTVSDQNPTSLRQPDFRSSLDLIGSFAKCFFHNRGVSSSTRSNGCVSTRCKTSTR